MTTHTNKRTNTTLSLIIAGLFSCIATLILSKIEYQQNSNTQEAQQTIQHKVLNIDKHDAISQALKNAENNMWEGLKTINIEKQDVNTETERWFKIYTERNAQSSKNELQTSGLSKDTETFIKNVINDLPVDAQAIKLRATDEYTTAYSNLDTVIINEKLLNRYSEEARAFIIAHEVAHIEFKDSLMAGIIEQIGNVNISALGETQPNHPVCKYSRFTEWRADMWACQNYKNGLKGYTAFCEESLKLPTQQPLFAKTHPLDTQRLACAQVLTKEIVSQNSVPLCI